MVAGLLVTALLVVATLVSVAGLSGLPAPPAPPPTPGAFVERAQEVADPGPPLIPTDATPDAAVRGVVQPTGGATLGGPVHVRLRGWASGGSLHLDEHRWALPGLGGAARFAFEGVHPGTFELTAWGPGFAPGLAGPVTVPPGGEIGGLLLEVGPGFEAAARVVDAAGDPLAGVPVRAWSRVGDSSVPLPERVSDAAGVARFPHHRPGSELVARVMHPGFQPSQVVWRPQSGGVQTLALEPAGVSGGRVVDAATGRPVAGAAVRLVRGFGVDPAGVHDPEARSRPPDATTDADGRFELRGLVSGRSGCVWVDHPRFGPALAYGLVAGGPPWELSLPPRRTPAVEVRGVGSLEPSERRLRWSQRITVAPHSTSSVNGGPIPLAAGAGVAAVRLPPLLADAPLEVRVGGRRFFFDDPLAGPLVVDLAPPQGAREVRVRLEPPPGWPATGGTLEVEVPGDGAFGTDRVELPVRGGVASFEAQPAADGSGGLAGFRVLRLDAPGYRPAAPFGRGWSPVPAGEGPHTVPVPLAPAGTAGGRVVDAAGEPVPLAAVAVRHLDKRGRWLPFLTVPSGEAGPPRVAADGRFGVSGLPLGVPLWLNAASHGGDTVAWGEPFLLTEAEPVREQTLVLPDGLGVTARVLGPGGVPIQRLRVRLVHGHGREVFHSLPAATDADGAVAFEGVNFDLPGVVRVETNGVLDAVDGRPAAAYTAAAARVTPEQRSVELRVEAGHTLRGRLVDDATGAPLAGVGVILFSADAPDPADPALPLNRRVHGATASDGSFELGGLTPGRWSLWVDPGVGAPPATPSTGPGPPSPGPWWSWEVPTPAPVEARVAVER